MPLNLPDGLPVIELLERENIFVMGQAKAVREGYPSTADCDRAIPVNYYCDDNPENASR